MRQASNSVGTFLRLTKLKDNQFSTCRMNPLPNVVFQIEAELSSDAEKIGDTNDTPTLGTTGSYYTEGDEEGSTLSNPTASTELLTAPKNTGSRPGISDRGTGDSIHQVSVRTSMFHV
jgi:hypothetical protein